MKPGLWKKFSFVLGSLLIVLLLIGASIPAVRQTVQVLWAYNANSFAVSSWQVIGSSETVAFRHDGHILVPAIVQGRHSVNIALDTGAPMSALISGPHLSDVSLNLGGVVPIGGAGEGNNPTARIISDLELTLGPIRFADLTALLIPFEQMGEFFSKPEQVYIHGILGHDLFSRYVVEIDFDDEVLTFHQPEEFSYDGNGIKLPLTYVQRKPYIVAEVSQLDGAKVPVKLQVDLGKPTALSLIPSDTIIVPTDAIDSESRGLSGRVIEKTGRISSLHLDTVALADVVTTFSIQGFATSGDRHGVLGLEVLERFKVIVDYPRNRIILEPRDTKRPFEDDMAGIVWIPSGDSFEIRRLRPGSPAESSDLAVGDALISINGEPASALRLRDLHRLMRKGDGEQITLVVNRGQQRRVTKLTLSARI